MSASEEISSTQQNQITTRSISGKLAKKITESTAAESTLNKILSTNTEPLVGERGKRRQWEVWSPCDKKYFFEALFEHGKDFDALQSFMALKHSRIRKENISTNLDPSPKTKNQIRHFYYRAWHKISPYIKQSSNDELGRQVLELYALICYGEMRRRCGGKIDDKLGRKLNELVTIGSTTVKIKGKKIHIKVPFCRALKRLHNVEEIRDESGRLKLPDRIRLEFLPRTNQDLWRVQSTMNNPRLAITSGLNARLSTLHEYLVAKWATQKDIYIEKLSGCRSAENAQLIFVVPDDSSLEKICITTTTFNQKTNFCYENLIANNKDHAKIFQLNSSPPPTRRHKPKSEDAPANSKIVVKNAEITVNKSLNSEVVHLDNKASFMDRNDEHNVAKDLEKNNVTNDGNKDGGANFMKLAGGDYANRTCLKVAINLEEGEEARFNASGISGCTSELNNGGRNDVYASGKVREADNMNDVEEKLLETRTIDYQMSKQLTVAQLYLMLGAKESIQLEYTWTEKDADSFSIKGSLKCLLQLCISEFASVGQDSASSYRSCEDNKTPIASNNVVNNPNKRNRRSPGQQNNELRPTAADFRHPVPPKNTRIIADKDTLSRMPLLQSLTDASCQKQRHKVQRKSNMSDRGWADGIDSADAAANMITANISSNTSMNQDGKTLITMQPSELFKSTTAVRRIVPIPLPPVPPTTSFNENNLTTSQTEAITGVDAFLIQGQASRESTTMDAVVVGLKPATEDSNAHLFDYVNNLSLPSLLDGSLCGDASTGAVDRILDIALNEESGTEERANFSNFKIGRFLTRDDSNGNN